LERAVGYVLIGSRGQEAQHLHLTFLVVSEYAAVQALMRITVAVLVIQSAIELFAVETLSISRYLKLQIGVLPAFEIAAWVHTSGYLVCVYIHVEALFKSLSSSAKDGTSVLPRTIEIV
jgi:hypothetical protein